MPGTYKPITRKAAYIPGKPKRSWMLTIVMYLLVVYTFLPLFWLIINSTKTENDLFGTFGLGPGHSFAFFSNVEQVFTYQHGVFLHWLANTLMYTAVGGGGSTLVATMAGYALAKYSFRGRRAVFGIVLGALAIPGTALTVPAFLLFSAVHLTNTPWAVILPSLISPFGLYLMWAYSIDSVPTDLIEAARVDGSGEFRTFFTISLRLMMPGVITVLLFNIVASWNNYFLPYIMLSNPTWYPLTVGLQAMNAQGSSGQGASIVHNAPPIFNLVITASLLTIIPVVIIFLLLQRYWQSGLTSGAVKS